MRRTKVFDKIVAGVFFVTLITFLLPLHAAGQAFVSRVIAQGGTLVQPTTLAIAPDGRLFVGQRDGRIHALNINGPCAISAQLISEAFYGRLVTGITFGPGGDLYLSHSDGQDYPLVNTESGMVSKLLAPSYTTRIDLVWGLPRSKADHAPNGVAFGLDGLLYLAVGGFTNAGLRSSQFNNQDEIANSAAILKIDVIHGGVPLRHATGFRNPYDLVWHSNGQLYATDNGTNGGFGNYPVSGCDPNQPGIDPGRRDDKLNRIIPGGYYGHPNFARGECVFGGGIGPLVYLSSSVQGIAEYNSGRVPSLLGNLFAANFTLGQVIRIQLAPGGTSVAAVSTYASGLSNPLDIAVSPDGRIFVAEFGAGRITEIVPLDSPNSFGYSAVPDFTGPDFFFDGRRRADIGDQYSNGHFWIRRNNGNGTFSPPGGLNSAEGDSAPPGADWQVLAADFTGDGYGDYVDRSRISGDFWVHENQRNGTFDPAGGFDWAFGRSVTGPAWEILAGDVDGDGRADIIEHNLVTGQLRFLHNGGTGYDTFTCAGSSAFRTPVGPDWRLLVADFTGDGYADVADFHIPSGHFWIHRNVGGYQFDLNNWGEGFGNVDPAAPGRWATIVGDFTGVGFADYADVQRDSGEFWVHENLRNGTFDPVGPPDWGYGLYTPWLGWNIFGLPVTFRHP